MHPWAIKGWLWSKHLVLYDKSWRPIQLTWHTNFNALVNQMSSILSMSHQLLHMYYKNNFAYIVSVLIKMLLHVWKKLSINFYNVWFYSRLGWFKHSSKISKSLGSELSTLQSLFLSILTYLYTFKLLAQIFHFPYHTNHFTCFRRVILIRVSIVIEMLCIQVRSNKWLFDYLIIYLWF